MPSPTQAAPLAPPKGRLDRAVTVLRQATQFTGEWLLQGFGVFLAFAFAYAAARFVAVAAFRVGFVAVEIAALGALAAATAIAIWATFGPARERRLGRLGRMEALGVSLAAVGFAVGTFAALTALFYDHGRLDVSGPRLAALGADDSQDSISGIAADFYLWHLLDSVPLLDIPDTLRWRKPYEYSDSLSGWLLLLFKAFVILPLIQVVRLIAAPAAARRAAGPRARSRRGAARQARL